MSHHHIALAIIALTLTSYCVFQNSLIVLNITLLFPVRSRPHCSSDQQCSHRMFLLLTIVVDILAYNNTDLCQVCQAPLLQNPRILWKHLLNNSTYYLVAWSSDVWSEFCQAIPSSQVLMYRFVCLSELMYEPIKFSHELFNCMPLPLRTRSIHRLFTSVTCKY